MTKQIQQFITRCTCEIKEKDLTGISGVSFIKGRRNYGTPLDVLKSKSFEGTAFGGKRHSLGDVAADMNAMFDCTDALCGISLFKKRVSGKLVPKGAGKPLKPHTDESFRFNDSRKLPQQVEKVSPDADAIICKYLSEAIK